MIEYRFAGRAAKVAAPVALAPARRDAIRLSAGNLYPPVLPDLSEEAAEALGEQRGETLQYGPLFGLDALRDGLVAFLADDGLAATRDNILVVNGGKQALELIGRVLIEPGDAVVVTAPTFLTAISIFGFEGARFISIAQDGEGMVVDELEAVLRERRLTGQAPPKLVFDMPDFHNPTGVTLSAARRRRLVALAEEHDFLIVEDDPYRRIRFAGEPLAPIKSLDVDGRVIGVGTMAKILAPGLKIGWINAPAAIVRRLAAVKMDGGSSPLTQRIVARLIENGRLRRIIEAIAAQMRQHRDAAASAFLSDLPEARFQLPQGGYFLWVEMPEDDCDVLAQAAESAGVSVFSGTHCFANAPRTNFLRVAYSYCSPEEIRTGVARLAEAHDALLRHSRV